jgi:hypothetical protein
VSKIRVIVGFGLRNLGSGIDKREDHRTPFYKVVLENQENPGTYVSALVNGRARMTYQIDKPAEVPPWLYNEVYYATAFNNLQAAQDFAAAVNVPTGESSPRIFEVEGEVIAKLPPRARIFDIAQGGIVPQPVLDWPAGTVMVKSLRLIRPIQ